MPYMRKDEFMSRLSASAPAGFRADIDSASAIVDQFGERVATIRNDKNLTNVGREQAMRNDVRLRGLLDHFRQMQNNVKKAKDHLAAQRAALVLPGPDKTDIFRELQRREMRDSLARMPVNERMRMALESKNPLVVEAVLHAPDPSLLGFPAAVHADFVKKQLQAAHGPRLQELAVLDKDVANYDSAIQVAGLDLRSAAAIDRTRFDQLLEPKEGDQGRAAA
jgi:hypothetical protein